MTSKKADPPESADKGAENVADDGAMERFKSLARKIVNVSNKKVLAERKSAARKGKKS